MSVSNGQIANQTTFNAAFMSRTAATTSTVAAVALNNPATSSISDIQKMTNQINDTVGISGLDDANRKVYSSNNVIADGDTRKEAIGKLDAEFDESTGHGHSGAPGDGKPVSALNLTDINKFVAVGQAFTRAGVTGTSTDVSSSMTGKTSGGANSVAGVITDAPYNQVFLVDTADYTFLEDSEGQRVYGKLTELAGVWTLSYFVNDDGVETPFNILSSTNILVYFLEVFSIADRPTISENPLAFGSLDLTQDVKDATASLRGLVSTVAQSFAGLKTFVGGIVNQNIFRGDYAVDSTTNGSAVSIASPAKMLLKVTHASLVSIKKITTPLASQFLVLTNGTGVDISILNFDTASDEILTGTGADLLLAAGASVWLMYDSHSSRWRVVGGSGSGSGGGLYFVVATQTITGGGTITTTDDPRQWLYVKGASGGAAASTTPFGGTDLWDDGTEIVLSGRDDSDYLDITFNDANYGVVGNFSTYELTKYKGLRCVWDKTNLRWLGSPA